MQERILIIRRDNIGDLVCTTPLLSRLRAARPHAHLSVLANSYNASVLQGNPYIDQLVTYTKAKHRGDQSLWLVYQQKWQLINRLRKQAIDLAILATPVPDKQGYKIARQIKAKRIVGIDEGSLQLSQDVHPEKVQGLHQVEQVFVAAGFEPHHEMIPPTQVFVTSDERVWASQQLQQAGCVGSQPIGIHISARKLHNRWSIAHFVSVIKTLLKVADRHIVLFWSPGSADNVQHPGDNEKAAQIIQQVAHPRLIAFPTETLRELIAGLSVLRVLLCSDGGAMHIAAGLKCPVVCLFGYDGAAQWRPWGVHTLLHHEPLNQLPPDKVINALLDYIDVDSSSI